MPDEDLKTTAVENSSSEDNNSSDLQDLESSSVGMEEPEIKNPQGLLSTLEKLKAEQKKSNQRQKELEERIQKYQNALGEMKPEEVRKRIEEQLIKEKKYDELIKRYQTENEQLRVQMEQVETNAKQSKIEYNAEKAFIEAGGIPGHFVAVKQAILSRSKMSEDGQFVLVDESGDIPFSAENKRAKTPKEVLLEDFVASDIWGSHFRVRVPSGSGATGSDTRLGISAQDIASLSPAERREQARKHGFKQ